MPKNMKELGEEMRRGYEKRQGMLKQLKEERARLARNTSEMLSDYRQEHKRISQVQKEELASDALRRAGEVKEMMQGYRADINETSTQWKEFSRLMQRIRKGEKVEEPESE
jgi:hypothetical protein